MAVVCRLVQGGQTVQWLQRMQGGERLQDMCVPAGLHVVYEDADLACVAKPQGMPVAVSLTPKLSTHYDPARPHSIGLLTTVVHCNVYSHQSTTL